MKKIATIFGLIAILVVSTGCAHSFGFSASKGSAGYYTRAHAWEEPHFTSDLKGNPVKSELGMGFVTVGSQAGWGDHPEGKWVSVGMDLGPDK